MFARTKMHQKDPSQRVTAALIVLSIPRRELWFVGDCQCMVDDRLIQNTKPVDDITAQARAMFLETKLQKGATIEALRQNDTGRAFILPLLKQQQLFQNNPAAGPYCYAVIDGFFVPDEGIRIEPVPPATQTLILASDGYPLLKESLEASEHELHHILEEDPLLFRLYKSTSGVQIGAASYDDRAYIKLRLRGEKEEERTSSALVSGSKRSHPLVGQPGEKAASRKRTRKKRK